MKYTLLIPGFLVLAWSIYSCKKNPSGASAEKIITITASDHTAWEIYGDSADFILNSGVPNSTGADLKVYLEVSGSAMIGSDCDSVISNGCVTIPPNQQYARIVVKGVRSDSILEETESIFLKITGCSSQEYAIGTPDQANIIIMDGNGPVVTDIDGNVYHSVLIGTQTWLVENLATTRFRNGDIVRSWCLKMKPQNCIIYGQLYQWKFMNDARGLCPPGWHVPSDAEWNTLINYLGGPGVAGGKMKEIGSEHWSSPNVDATNESGFTALPGGFRDWRFNFQKIKDGYSAYYWTSTDNGSRPTAPSLYHHHPFVETNQYEMDHALSVRCIKD